MTVRQRETDSETETHRETDSETDRERDVLVPMTPSSSTAVTVRLPARMP